MKNRVITYNEVEYYRVDSYWVENEVTILYGHLQAPTIADVEVSKILERIYFREDKLKRILNEKISTK